MLFRSQIIVKKEKAKIADYSKHFFSLYAHSNEKRESLIAEYTNNLSTLVSESNFTATRHYAIFSVSCNPAKQSEKVQAIKKLNDMSMRFASALASCDISVRLLENEAYLPIHTAS